MDFFIAKLSQLDLTTCRREKNKIIHNFVNRILFKTKPGLIIQIETKY
jgi:hypothetical protein